MIGKAMPLRRGGARRLVPALVVFVLLGGLCGLMRVAAAGASGPATVGCSAADVQDALDAGGSYVFSGSCTLQLSAPLTMTGGAVTLDGQNSSSVTILGGPTTQLFLVTGGSLTLENLTLEGGTAQGQNGADNTSNGDGGSGSAGQGGAMMISAGASVTLTGDTVQNNDAFGGNGGAGGCGCNVSNSNGVPGGNGAKGAAGEGGAIYNQGTLTISTTTLSGNEAEGGSGGDAGAGGGGVDTAAGDSGNGADGGAGQGGAIYNAGELSITNSSFSNGYAYGGPGGGGAIGGYTGTTMSGTYYQAGNGGQGGNGGDGDGGAIYDVGTMNVTGSSFDDLSATGGDGGEGGQLGVSDEFDVDYGNPGDGGNGGDAIHGAVDSTAALNGAELGCGNTVTAGQGGLAGPGATGHTASPGQPGTASDPDDGPGCTPTVDSVAPNTGPTAGGTTVVITGKNFIGATNVAFQGLGFSLPAASFTVQSDNVIDAVTPAVPANDLSDGKSVTDVIVTNTYGPSAANPPNDTFTFTTSTVVNGTGTAPEVSPDPGYCDTGRMLTIGGKQVPECTLPAAVQTANAHGGATITFDIPGGGVPQIAFPQGGATLAITQSATIDGTTQPGSGRVELTNAGIDCGAQCTLRGLALNGDNPFITLRGDGSVVQGVFVGTDPTGRTAAFSGSPDLFVLSSHDTIGGSEPEQGNVLVTGPCTSSHNCAAVVAEGNNMQHVAPSDNRFIGNTIGAPLGVTTSAPGYAVLIGSHDTVGGPGSGDANVFTVGVELGAKGDTAVTGSDGAEVTGDVVQGNSFAGGLSVVGDANTIGGATDRPGTGRGNDLSVRDDSEGVGLDVSGNRNVIQGNAIRGHGYGSGIELYLTRSSVLSDHNTIGGDSADLGNLIEGFGQVPNGFSPNPLLGGIGIVYGSNTVIEHNVFRANLGGGAVDIAEQTPACALDNVGNDVFENEMSGDSLGVNLGGGPFRPNPTRNPSLCGPNHFQPYPVLWKAARHGADAVELTGRAFGLQPTSYRIDLYSQGSCFLPGGEGEHYLGSREVHVGLGGSADFTLTYSLADAAGQHELTATATDPDGSTSEFSPCVSLGEDLTTFQKNGIVLDGGTIVPSIPNGGLRAQDNPTAATAAARRTKDRALVYTFCPPITTRVCVGALTLRTTSGQRIATLHFKLRPGQLNELSFGLSPALAKQLLARRSIRLRAMAVAHDGAKHPRVRTSRGPIMFTLD